MNISANINDYSLSWRVTISEIINSSDASQPKAYEGLRGHNLYGNCVHSHVRYASWAVWDYLTSEVPWASIFSRLYAYFERVFHYRPILLVLEHRLFNGDYYRQRCGLPDCTLALLMWMIANLFLPFIAFLSLST